MKTKAVSRSRPHHQITSQLQFDFTLGPIKIKDGLFMGDEFAAKVATATIKDIEFILTNKVSHVINTVCRRIPNLWEKVGVQYLPFNWADNEQNVPRWLMKLFDKKNATVNAIFNFIEEAMIEGQSCLVHSSSCKSRAFTVVGAYLIKKYSWSMEKALEFVKLKKPELKVKQTFLAQLKDLEMRLSKGQGFSSEWNEVQNEQDLVLKNTYHNTNIPIEEALTKQTANKNSNRKKISWKDSDTRNTTKYNLDRHYGMIAREPPMQAFNDQPTRPLKSILKNFTSNSAQEQPEVRVVTEQRQMVVSKPMENPSMIPINNFLGNDTQQKPVPDRFATVKKQIPNPPNAPVSAVKPHLTRPFSSDAKQREKRAKQSKQPKFTTYDALNSFKSPYEYKLMQNKLLAKSVKPSGMKREEDAYKPLAFYERPHSSSNADKRKPNKGLLQEAKRQQPKTSTTANGMLSRKQQEQFNALLSQNFNG